MLIKVNLSIDSHSTGRGIGFYANNLKSALEKLPEIELTTQNPDLIHYPYFDLFFPTLKVGKTPTIVTIHDLTPLILKDLYPQGFRGAFNLLRQRFALKNVKAIITDSQNSKEDIANLLKINKAKIFVTPLAADPIYSRKISTTELKKIKQKYSLPDRFVLYVGGVNPNKNLPRLVEACLNLDVPLVLVGSEFIKPLSHPVHSELKDLELIQNTVNNHPGIITPGFISSEDLVGFYKLASLYCQPSLYEGFGLPLLEAMSAGCLVVSSHTSSLPELYPDNTINFDPHNQLSLNQALRYALNLKAIEKQKFIKAGISRAKDFSWEKTAQLTLSVYQSVLS